MHYEILQGSFSELLILQLSLKLKEIEKVQTSIGEMQFCADEVQWSEMQHGLYEEVDYVSVEV